MGRFARARRKLGFAVLAGLLVAAVIASTAASAGSDPLRKINHIVVIYEENHSFDNLYGGWEGVNGRSNATNATQVSQAGSPYACLLQNDVNLTSPPQDDFCAAATTGTPGTPAMHFTNSPFKI